MNIQDLQTKAEQARRYLKNFINQDEARAQAEREVKAAEDELQSLKDRVNSNAYKADEKRADKLESEIADALQEAERGIDGVKAVLDKAVSKHNEFKTLVRSLDDLTKDQQQNRIYSKVHSDVNELLVYVDRWLERRKFLEGLKQTRKTAL